MFHSQKNIIRRLGYEDGHVLNYIKGTSPISSKKERGKNLESLSEAKGKTDRKLTKWIDWNIGKNTDNFLSNCTLALDGTEANGSHLTKVLTA